jgi:8-oxo-dGTP pyrophosphatase MutT (NUDIX family)
MMQRYVLGFAFNTQGRVALIRKLHPEWQAGRWNGIGGKIDARDASDRAAMSREFREETGVEIPAELWRRVAFMRGYGLGWAVSVFTVVHPSVDDVQTTEAEEVQLWHPDAFHHKVHRIAAINNIPLLLEMCKLQPDGDHNSVELELLYR